MNYSTTRFQFGLSNNFAVLPKFSILNFKLIFLKIKFFIRQRLKSNISATFMVTDIRLDSFNTFYHSL